MESRIEPDQTAVRTALWRAMHVELDAPPHVIEDEIGLALVAPPAGWKSRPDMHPEGTKPFRASMVARARFIEDLVEEALRDGVKQYVLLGAGLDTFAQRKPELASRMHVFEVDRPSPQAWKKERLVALGYGVPDWLHFVGVDFEKGATFLERLVAEGFSPNEPSVIASTGVSMYLGREANEATLRDVASLAKGTTFAMSFLLPIERADPEAREGLERSAKGARASGTPFVSFFDPPDLLEMAKNAGFRECSHVSAEALGARYFANRTDGLRPPRNAEEILVAKT